MAVAAYVERGSKRVFVGAVDWPGWCRSGREEAAAIEALLAYAPRYRSALKGIRPAPPLPASPDDVRIVERVRGDATTDFGAPAIPLEADARAFDDAALTRAAAMLGACWSAFDAAASAAADRELAKGPRGGGRDLDAIVDHVVASESAYLRKLGTRGPDPAQAGLTPEVVAAEREAVRGTLAAAARDGLPARGPRGGTIWLPRYFVRRAAWHVLDHAWEIQDRAG